MSVRTRFKMLVRSVAVGALVIMGSLTMIPDGQAQDANIRRILSPEETRQCICSQAQIEALQGKLAEFDPLDQEYQRLDDLITRARPNIDTSDEAEVDSFRRLYNKRESLRLQLQSQRGPYVSQLNGMASTYNAQCANQRMLKVNVDAVNADPNACPQPQ